nr:MAG TPA: hypothetical protein [Caudoviricetes sp.]
MYFVEYEYLNSPYTLVSELSIFHNGLAADYLRSDILKTFTPNLSTYVVVI